MKTYQGKNRWVAAGLALLLLAGLPAHAEPWNQPDGGRRAEPRVSAGEASERAQRATGGRVLQAQSVRVQGRDMYRIKVITPRGEVRVVHVDAATGGVE